MYPKKAQWLEKKEFLSKVEAWNFPVLTSGLFGRSRHNLVVLAALPSKLLSLHF